jgi:GWxTD domain-containing protein
MRAGAARAFVAVLSLVSLSAPSADSRRPDLPSDEREWLDSFVAPIVLPDERRLFLELTEGWERDLFRVDFWERRERPGLAYPLGPGYRDRYRELREASDEHYDGWRSDAGRTVIRYGIPEIDHLEGCDGTFRDLEIWTYRPANAIGRGVIRHLFYRRYPSEPRRMWSTAIPQSELMAPNSCRKSVAALGADCGLVPTAPNDPCINRSCAAACRVVEAFNEIVARQGSGVSGAMEVAQWVAQPPVSLEGLDGLRGRLATLGREGARKIAVETGGRPPEPASAPAPLVRTSEALRERILALDRKSRDWLDLALPILSEKELLEFLALPEGGRAAFIRRFWKKHS